MTTAAIVGVGERGQRLVKSVQGKSERIRFAAVARTPEKARAFAGEREPPCILCGSALGESVSSNASGHGRALPQILSVDYFHRHSLEIEIVEQTHVDAHF